MQRRMIPTGVVDIRPGSPYAPIAVVDSSFGRGNVEIVLYERELEVMRVLWERGPSTVAEVRAVIGGAQLAS